LSVSGLKFKKPASRASLRFLNLDEPYPREVFTILIWGSDRAKFGTPEMKYKDAKVCVTGKITSYRGKYFETKLLHSVPALSKPNDMPTT
jgi:hypothetical protein